jgi:hypothetical protein
MFLGESSDAPRLRRKNAAPPRMAVSTKAAIQ